MDQGSILVFLHLKRLSAKVKDVHTDLVQVLGPDAIRYSAMSKYVSNDVILQNEPEAGDRAEDENFSITDNAILEAFEIMPFASILRIAKMTFILPTTGFRRFDRISAICRAYSAGQERV
jgi:hypothetical protein